MSTIVFDSADEMNRLFPSSSFEQCVDFGCQETCEDTETLEALAGGTRVYLIMCKDRHLSLTTSHALAAHRTRPSGGVSEVVTSSQHKHS